MEKMRLIKYFLSYIFILILLFLSCSKEGPTALGPFTLNVDNQTKYDYDVYVMDHALLKLKEILESLPNL